MSEQPSYQNPQELFQALTKETGHFWQSFMSNQGHEMMRQFTTAWNDLLEQTMNQHSNKWIEIMTHYQQEQIKLWMNLLGAPLGENVKPIVSPPPGDKRFAAKEWDQNPVFNYLKQSYLLASDMLTQAAESTEIDEKNKKKLRFYTRYFIDAMSPTNFAATNPEVMQLALETKGKSLVDGLQNMMEDMKKGHISMTDESRFELGKNLAVTPGGVVFENEFIQLIQYKPSTETVSDRPIVIVPPFINKFYILDLQPDNSYAKFCVDQGNTTFMVSWVNPDETLRNATWDDYLAKGVLKALEVAQEVTQAKQINAVSWCVGGTILSSALAFMSAHNSDMVATGTFFTTMLDFKEPGDLGVFIDEIQVAQRESQVQEKGMLPGQDLATTFSMLRANDLIWSYVVNNYLKGKTPAPFDILYWNSDPTNLPASMYSYYLRNMYLDNKLREPGGLTMCGVPIDLRKIQIPCYFLSTIDDHIAPWTSTFNNTQLVSGPVEFVLGASGHIAGVVNPASKNKRNYWIEGELDKGAAHWLKTAKSTPGSWWNHWSKWIKKQSNTQIAPPQALGSEKYPVIEPAPGRYVKRRS